MKKFFAAILFLIILNNIFADDNDIRVFDSVEKSVLYIEASFFLDKKYFTNHELIKKIENKYKKAILDSYLPVQTGSAFFISGSGYLLTNEHVVSINDLNIAKIEAYNRVLYEALSKIPEDILDAASYKAVKSDMKSAIDNAKLYYRIMVNNKNYYSCAIVNLNKDLDIAVLKIYDKLNIKPIVLSNSSQIKVGEKCIAIGYPRSFEFFELFKDMKSTMTIGTVSAVRSDNWGIQHTAAVNPGNSGGPLLNKNGDAIGINVGLIANSSGLFFSIPSDKVISWLNSCNLGSIVSANKSGKTSSDSEYFEIGKKISIDITEGFSVYINGKLYGKTPLKIDTLPSGVITIRLESDSEFSEQKFKVVSDNNEIFSYTPQTTKFFGKLLINTNPAGAKFFLDDIEIGLTPNSFNNINTGKHTIKVTYDGYIALIKEILINKNEVLKLNEKLIKGVTVRFKEKLPDDTVIKVKSKKGEYTFRSNETILLLPDKYEFELSSKKILLQKMTVDASAGKDITLDEKINIITSKLVLKNLKKESKIFIANEDITDKLKDNFIDLEIGDYQLKVVTAGFKSFIKKINIEDKKDTIILMDYFSEKLDYLPFYRAKCAMLGVGIPFLSIGGLMLTIGLSAYCVEEYVVFPKDNTFYYNDPSVIAQKNAFLAVMGTGAGVSSLGLLMLIASIPLNYYQKKIENYGSASLILDINESSFTVGMKVKF